MCGSRGVGWGGRGLGSGPDPVPGKSQVLSNSIEISIWTPPPPLNSWTPRIPGKFWTKKTQNNHKKSRLFSRRWAWTPPPPPLSLTKKSGSAHALTIQPLTPGSPNVRRNYMVMSVPWLNYPLTIEALTGGGGGGEGSQK